MPSAAHQRTARQAGFPACSLSFAEKNQVTIPVAALEEVGLHAGERVTIEPAGDGELRIRRAARTFDDAFGALTGTYPPGYLDRLDAEDQQR